MSSLRNRRASSRHSTSGSGISAIRWREPAHRLRMRFKPKEIDMSGKRVDFKLEVVVIPVSDVDRAKRFYGGLGWRLDADFPVSDAFRVVQFTPPGSPCSVHFGTGLTPTAPGSAKGNYLVVSDIEAARANLVERGV